jgi:hypothetical protein
MQLWKYDGNRRSDPITDLGQHLFAYYIWGQDELEGEMSLLRGFYKKTDPEQWSALFDHVGRSLKNGGPKIRPDIRVRCEAFFEYRLAEGSAKELQAFTFWLEASCLSPAWRLRALSRTLDITKGRGRGISILVQGLHGLLDDQPDLVLECFAKLTEGALSQEQFYLEPEKAKRILQVGLASKNRSTVQAAQKAQENLLRAGHSEYLHLVKAQNTE